MAAVTSRIPDQKDFASALTMISYECLVAMSFLEVVRKRLAAQICLIEISFWSRWLAPSQLRQTILFECYCQDSKTDYFIGQRSMS